MTGRMRQAIQMTSWGLLLAAVACVPLVASGYHLRFLTLLFMWAALAGCWNLVAGFTGYIDFGPVAYYGIGGYVTAILMTRTGAGLLPSLLAAGLVAVVIGAAFGAPTLRLRGPYFAIATLALAEAVKQIVLEWDKIFQANLTGGPHGLTLPLKLPYPVFYELMLATMLAVFLLTGWVRRSRFGYGLRAIGGAEEAAKACGVNVFRLKLCAYTASAFFLAVVGGIAATWLSYISPEDAFDINTTIQIIVITLLGGIGHTWGALVGAAFLTVVSEVLWARFIHTYLIILGIVIVGVVIYMPGGITGLLRSRVRPAAHP